MQRDGRRILFEGIVNCRDLGGIKNTEGAVVREGLLLRSANLARATKKDIKELSEEIRLSKIIDLRNSQEQYELLDQEIPGAEHVDCPIFEDLAPGITHEDNRPPFEKYPPMTVMYAEFVKNPLAAKNMAKAARMVMTHDFRKGPVLWHCFGGKDRCGMVAALTLDVLGVSYEDILADYMMTNVTAAVSAAAEVEKVTARGGSQKEIDFVYQANIASEDYLNNAFKALDENYGNGENFIKALTGAPDEEFDRFRETALEWS
ncbi:MAG: tyrosine-protein phosphatase [Lachnospiraceae bacterium]|nr:tyrosine-protein phosphatase [Lachnospiraceae bacterium]